MDQLDQLSNMKYADLLKLAKQKLNITKRITKAKLIQSLMELEWLSDVEETETTIEKSPTEPADQQEPVVKTTDQASNQVAEEVKPHERRTRSRSGRIHKKDNEVTTEEIRKELATQNCKDRENSAVSEGVQRRGRKRAKRDEVKEESMAEKEPAPKDEHPVKKKNKTENNTVLNSTFSIEESSEESSKLLEEALKPKEEETLKPEGEEALKPKVILREPLKEATPAKSKAQLAKVSASGTKSKAKAVPNFAQLHQRQFEKMQSVEEYAEKKRQRMETLTVSGRKAPTSALKTPGKSAAVAAPAAARARLDFQSVAEVPMPVLKQSPPQRPALSSNAALDLPKPTIQNPAKKLEIPKTVPREALKRSTSMTPVPKAKMDFNFVSGIQKPVFTAAGLVATQKKRLMATVKENQAASPRRTPRRDSAAPTTTATTTTTKDRLGEQLKLTQKVRTNRRFELQMQHRRLHNNH